MVGFWNVNKQKNLLTSPRNLSHQQAVFSGKTCGRRVHLGARIRAAPYARAPEVSEVASVLQLASLLTGKARRVTPPPLALT